MTRPAFELGQDDTLFWLAQAHAQSEATARSMSAAERDAFRDRIGKVVQRCACGSDRIARRASVLADVMSTDWTRMELFDLCRHPCGQGMAARTRFFARTVNHYLADEYAGESSPPADLIHVSCTGYMSPSAAQSMVERKGWGSHTRVTHAYHMGCYAALPALRMARGFLLADDGSDDAERRADVVHTELCSIHLDPSVHTPEQFVVQSLFSDGFIRYCVSRSEEEHRRAFEVRSLCEAIIPDSSDAMTWVTSDWGMRMTLARDVPERLAYSLKPFIARVYEESGMDASTHLGRTVFAVHPGGPKIIDQLCDIIRLREDQVAASRGVLLDFGNMSSATLPHVWMRILEDADVAPGTPVLSLAFGPGLTVCGSMFVKR